MMGCLENVWISWVVFGKNSRKAYLIKNFKKKILWSVMLPDNTPVSEPNLQVGHLRICKMFEGLGIGLT
jgi:hypothetical protein